MLELRQVGPLQEEVAIVAIKEGVPGWALSDGNGQYEDGKSGDQHNLRLSKLAA